ncbi:hypothetical protein [Senegalia massiliensis]|uniref:Uncharacterized protein n=1 Tax=Senegalia massiliensis TaxID=1720316 RepID=A0A845QX71_9CLOT|nr:hypothetical protein [Senegalia massiliensis]NBI05748.1 hypothetical protein [Senegalia massiliensis]
MDSLEIIFNNADNIIDTLNIIYLIITPMLTIGIAFMGWNKSSDASKIELKAKEKHHKEQLELIKANHKEEMKIIKESEKNKIKKHLEIETMDLIFKETTLLKKDIQNYYQNFCFINKLNLKNKEEILIKLLKDLDIAENEKLEKLIHDRKGEIFNENLIKKLNNIEKYYDVLFEKLDILINIHESRKPILISYSDFYLKLYDLYSDFTKNYKTTCKVVSDINRIINKDQDNLEAKRDELIDFFNNTTLHILNDLILILFKIEGKLHDDTLGEIFDLPADAFLKNLEKNEHKLLYKRIE